MSQTISRITFEYIPWAAHYNGAVDEEILKSSEHYSYTVTCDSTLNEFKRTLNLLNFEDRPLYRIDIRMIMRIHLSNGQEVRLLFSSNGVKNGPGDIKMNGCRIAYNKKLNSLISYVLSEKLTFPNDTLKYHVKKGTFSEKEIQQYKEKGVIIIEDL